MATIYGTFKLVMLWACLTRGDVQQLFDCRREGTNIPLVVATCIQEVIQRGIYLLFCFS